MSNLLATLQSASDLLASYLVDNTEVVFEEIPEVDEVRTLIDDAAEEIKLLLDKLDSLLSEISIMRDFSNDNFFRGFSEYALHDNEGIAVEWPNLHICTTDLEEFLKVKDCTFQTDSTSKETTNELCPTNSFDDVVVDVPTSPTIKEIAAGEVNLHLESGQVITFDSHDGKHCSICSKGDDLVISSNFEAVWSGKNSEPAIEEVAKLMGWRD